MLSEEVAQSYLSSTARYFLEYTESAYFHGIRYISRSSSFERIIWGLITVTCILIMSSQIFLLLTKIYNHPVVITFAHQKKPVYEIPFPAVTICSAAKVDGSKLSYKDINIKLKNKQNLSKYEQEVYEYLYFLCDHQKIESTETFTMKHFPETMYEVIENLSNGVSDVFLNCIWMKKSINCFKLFTPIFIDEGICFSFNLLDKKHLFKPVTKIHEHFFESFNKDNDWDVVDGYEPFSDLENYPRRVLMAGSDNALDVSLLFYEEDLDYSCKSSLQGFKVIIHNPTDVPAGRSNFFDVAPGRSYIAAIRPRMVASLSRNVIEFSPQKRKCYLGNEKPMKYYKIYSQDNCFIECLSNYTLLRCECVAYDMPRSDDIPICGASFYQCVIDAEKELEFLEIQNKIQRNSSDSPTFCDCLPSCTELSFKAEISLSETFQRSLQNVTALQNSR